MDHCGSVVPKNSCFDQLFNNYFGFCCNNHNIIYIIITIISIINTVKMLNIRCYPQVIFRDI